MDQAVQTRIAGRNGAGPPRVPIAFHLTGKRSADDLDAIDPLGLRPALFAGYHNLTTLRYDFPLVIMRDGGHATRVDSMSGLFDAALKDLSDTPEDERVRWYGLRMEQRIRALAVGATAGSFSDLWMLAASRLALPDDERFRAGVRRLRCALPADGEVVDCAPGMPSRLCRHLWDEAQGRKASRFRDSVKQLVIRLAEILRADFDRSEFGLSAERLKASVGTAHRDTIDFERMSRLLLEGSRGTSLSPDRRRRIEWLLFVLTTQRFFPITDETGDAATVPYGFAFESAAEAIAAYRERLPALIELAKAIAMAELEAGGQYNESKHDDFFADFSADNLDEGDFDLFPDYLIRVCARDRSVTEAEALLDAFPAGLRAKVLVQFDDILVPSPDVRRQAVFDGRSKQLASAAIGLGAFYVLQASASSLFRLREQLRRGMTYAGPALFIVFSGAPGTVGDLPPYLVAAAATESRVFPSFAYDPSAGTDWASRFQLLDNPQPERDWPTHTLSFADEAHQRVSENLAFTPADFVACDHRHARHFALLPRARWNDSLLPAAAFLGEGQKLSDNVPYVMMVDQRQVLHKVIVDDKLVREARRCTDSWRSLQELGGIHNSHAERLLAEDRNLRAEQSQRPTPAGGNGAAATEAAAAPAPAPAAAAAPAPAPVPPAAPSDDPYIETPRCTTCNECTQINDKMFAYDANKQAYIANPDAGTYRQIVEAAESCQVAIIHPGKPRNPREPGLDELLKRAEPFL